MERQTIFDRNAVEANMRLGIDTLMRHIEAVGRTAMQCELERLRAELELVKGLNDEQVEKLRELRAELEKWKRIRTPTHGSCCTCQACGLDYDSCRCDLDDVADELERLRAENAALEADKRRLDWLTEAMRERRSWMVVHPVETPPTNPWWDRFKPAQFLRDAIDEARELDAREESDASW